MLVSRILQTTKFATDVKHRFKAEKPILKSDAEWLKNRLQEMGPTYIKIGQFMSARRDIFDKHIVESLKDLQDKVTPIEKEVVKQTIQNAIGVDKFRKIEINPIASASIGQVHRGILRDGKEVVLKVRRPQIEEMINLDIKILTYLLDAIQFIGLVNVEETREILEDFRDFVLKEADYKIELENMNLFYKFNKDHETLVIPRPVDILCTTDIIVMEYLPSKKITDLKHTLTESQRTELAYKIMDLFVIHLISDGVIHGDPHEGNFGIQGDNIVMYDFGNIITIDAELRSQMKRLVFELMVENIDAAIDVLKQINVVNIRDEERLRVYLKKYIEYFKTLDIKVFKFSDKEMYSTLPIKLDGVIFRLIRAFGMIEGICKDLDPNFNYNTVFMKYFDMLIMDPGFVEYRIRTDIRSILKGIMKAF
jgi:ubiquinone biosynthesis protein